MARVRLDHLTWSKTEVARHAHNLADSAIVAPDLAALGFPHLGRLPAEGYAVQEGLERGLGARLGAPGGRVLVTAGASEANAVVFATLLAPGDEVLVESPGYEPLRRVPETFGATVRAFPRTGVPGELAPAIERALGPATRLVVLSDLHNPTGRPLDPGDAEALAELSRRRGVRVLCDETFHDAAERPLGTRAGAAEGWIATGSLTKAYGLGGLRIGWIAAPPAALAAFEDGQNALSVQPSLPSLALAHDLLPFLDRLRARTHGILAANHARWAAFTAAHPRFAGPRSQGTTTWCEFEGEAEGDAFAAFASARFDIAIARGAFFGRPRGIRIALGGEPAPFSAALEALGAAARAFEWSGAVQEHA